MDGVPRSQIAVDGDEENEMFTVNHLAVSAEDNYRREVLRDQSQNNSRAGKFTFLLLASAMLLAACGVATDTNTNSNSRDVVAAVSDPGPPWAPTTGDVEVAGISVNSFGVFAGPTHNPNYGLLEEILGDHGVFSAPRWDVSQSAIDDALGIARDAGTPGDSEPLGLPNYGRLETVLGTGGQQSGPQ